MYDLANDPQKRGIINEDFESIFGLLAQKITKKKQ